MPRFTWSIVALWLTSLPLTTVRAQERATAERPAVLAAVDSLLAAMSRRDVALSRRLLVPGAAFHSILDGEAPAAPRMQSDSGYLRSLASDTSALRERIWEPTTMIAGALAQVWAPYDFHVNGTFSHCGIDSFLLLKTTVGWQIAAVAYTVRRQGCARSPLGPLTP
ncbi:MAG: nuclear transport factor 2 family protein [Gemmatimonadales bacterium]